MTYLDDETLAVNPWNQMRILKTILFGVALACWPIPGRVVGNEPLPFDTLGRGFEQDVRPLLEQYCLTCHSTLEREGELDLERFGKFDDVRRDPQTWQKVLEMLDNGEMPPEDSQRLSGDQFGLLRSWVRGYLDAEAKAAAGDPGPVVLRRLNNAEYTYTVRDLTGVQLDPAREFPTDGAAGEGFTNTGQALAMSPALVQKYLEAGKQIASHALLLPNGFRFSPHNTQRDWTDECLTEIREFYRKFTDSADLGSTYEGNKMTQLGQAGRLPLQKYLAATLILRDRSDIGPETIEKVARGNHLSTRYLSMLWSWLSRTEPAFFLDGFRESWRNAKPEEVDALTNRFTRWQKALWVFGPIGRIGTKTGPSRWMVPVDPLVNQQEVRFSMPKPGEGEAKKDHVLSLVVSDAGDGNEHDFVMWKQPRLIMEGEPDILLRDLRETAGDTKATGPSERIDEVTSWGLDPARFGKHPNGQEVDAASLVVQAPSLVTIQIPADWAAGRTFVATAVLHQPTGEEGSVQAELVAGTPESPSGLRPIDVTVEYEATKEEFSKRQKFMFSRPILVTDGSDARRRIESSWEKFRNVFPAALCYTQLVPVDEYLTITLFYREDDYLIRLLLDETQTAELERLWEEFHFVSQSADLQLTALEMYLETQANSGGEYDVFVPLLKPMTHQVEVHREALIESESHQFEALLKFASRAYRRPLSDEEKDRLRALYDVLRMSGRPHDESFRLTLARIFTSPEFLYRLEERKLAVELDPAVNVRATGHRITDLELASRLSYFLWSSLPDESLRSVAETGRLTQQQTEANNVGAAENLEDSSHEGPTELLRQSRRMLKDPRVRRMAIEFACQWLHIREFDQLREKSAVHYPGFAALQEDMYDESIRFFTDMFQNGGSILDTIQSEHTFLNGSLAAHYGMSDLNISEWQRVDGVGKYSRGGILTQATILSRQAGASRNNPILRGNFIFETLLGQRMPRPPQDVPELPDEIPAGLTERELIEQHSSVKACAKCHARIDPYGFALEKFDAIGRRREEDGNGHLIDVGTTLIDGTKIEGLQGLQEHLLTTRRDDFVRQFCRKLLGYALGRGVQLSDEPLLDTMLLRLEKNDYRFTRAVDTIVESDQFRRIREKPAAP